MRALVLAFVLAAGAVSAQPTLTVTGAVGVPQAGFRDALGRVSGGIGVGFVYQIPRTPLAVGVEGAMMTYGSEHRREPWSLTIPDVRLDVQTSNNVAQALAVVRLQVPDGPVRPYADALIGANHLFTQTDVRREYYHGEEPLASSTNYDDTALVYGAGLGAQVRVHTDVSDGGRPYEVLIDGRVRYLAGGEASYLGRGDITRYDDGTYDVTPRRSRTDLLVPQLGVTVRF